MQRLLRWKEFSGNNNFQSKSTGCCRGVHFMERGSCVIFLKKNNTGNYCLHDKEIAQETNLTEKLHIGCKIFL